jgi:putative membrane protein
VANGNPRASSLIMKHPQIAAIATAMLLAGSVAAQRVNEANRTTPGDGSFVTKAVRGGLAEVEMGNLAKQRASNDKVKEFGQKMIDDHSKANDELRALATRKGLSVPGSVDSDTRATMKRLSGLHGAAFDRAYMKDMVDDHEKDVADFQRESQDGADDDMKAFAAKTLPILKQHLKMAQDTLSEVEKIEAH